jgi:hypothetical protein
VLEGVAPGGVYNWKVMLVGTYIDDDAKGGE